MHNHTIKYIYRVIKRSEKLHGNWSQQCVISTLFFLRTVNSLWYMFHLSFFGSIIEAIRFEDEFFLGEENVTQKKSERGSGVDQNLTF
jgi:hypothetical protein